MTFLLIFEKKLILILEKFLKLLLSVRHEYIN